MPNVLRPRHAHLGVALALALLGAVPLSAQAADAPAMAFPRETLTWFFAGEGDKVWARASPPLRTLMGSAQQLRQQSAEMLQDMGRETALLSEQDIEHPEGNGARVYVRAARHANGPELFWYVIYLPAAQQVQMISAAPRTTIRTLFPAVKLP
jgi:hypothetical protein